MSDEELSAEDALLKRQRKEKKDLQVKREYLELLLVLKSFCFRPKFKV